MTIYPKTATLVAVFGDYIAENGDNCILYISRHFRRLHSPKTAAVSGDYSLRKQQL